MDTLLNEIQPKKEEDHKLAPFHSPDEAVEACLDALLYQGWIERPLTISILNLLEDAKPIMGEANALLIEGIRQFSWRSIPMKHFFQAEEKGCDHPILHVYLSLLYDSSPRGTTKSADKVFEHCIKAIQGL